MLKCVLHTRLHGHNGLDATLLADSEINDRLIERHSLIDQTFLSSSVSYFAVFYFHRKIFNTPKLLNRVAPFVELMTQR